MPLRQRGGVWYLRKMVKGVRLEECLRTTNRKVAERLAAARTVELYEKKAKSYTFASWWAHFKRTHLWQKGASAQAGYKRTVEPLLKEWGPRALEDISTHDCSAFIARRLGEGAPASTVAVERQYLKALFTVAVEHEVLTRSPWVGRHPLKVLPRTRVLSPEEEQKLLAAAKPKLRDIIQLLLATGLRVQELCSATPQDLIALPAPGLRVMGKGQKIRVVPLTDHSLPIAQRILPIGITDSALLASLKTAVKRAGIPPLTLHDLRRTFGTRCAQENMPISILSGIMGHSNITITAKYYIHITSMTAFEAMKKVGDRRVTPDVGPTTEAKSG